MADVLELAALDLAGGEGQAGVLAFQRLHPGQFVGAHGALPLRGQPGGRPVQPGHVGHFVVELLVGRRAQPVADAVWLEVPLLSSRAAWRRERRPTMPRRTISAAIARPVHWLIGRPDWAGASQASATIWHCCSAPSVGWRPGRGASASRSATRRSAKATGYNPSQRPRHSRAVATSTPSRRAIW